MMFEQRESVVASDLLLSPEADRRSLLKRAHQNSGSESQNNGTNFRKRLHSDHGSPISAAQGIESNEEILDSNGGSFFFSAVLVVRPQGLTVPIVF